jgi:phosphoribosylanthranilate isomerase
MSRIRVKICGITRPQDVDAAVAAGADALGFVFTPRSKRHVTIEAARELVARVPAFVSRVGLFMDQEANDVAAVLKQVPLSLLQFHGRESGAYCSRFGMPYIKALDVAGATAPGLAQEYAGAAALLLDSHEAGAPGGTGNTFDWTSIPELPKPLILAGGLNPENVRRAVASVAPWAVDVSSGVEDSPGVKNEGKMIEFINEAKCEN